MIEKLRAVLTKVPAVFERRANSLYALALTTAILLSVLMLSVNTVSIKADGKEVVTLKTMLSNTDSILESVNISYGKDDKVEVKKLSSHAIDIAVRYSFPVYITVGNTTSKVLTTGATVGEILDLANVLVSEHDIINYDLDTKIDATAYIDVVDIDYVTETYTKRIYYQEKTVYSSDYPKGTRIVKDGTEGQKQITCKKTIVNGVVTSEEVLSEVVLFEAVDRQIIIGTKKTATANKTPAAAKPSKPTTTNPAVTTSANVSCVSTLKPASTIELDKNGNPVKYKKHLTVQATAYLASGTCATGVKCVPGYIAVNPNYIPYGTKMYIKSSDGKYVYGYAVAADTGGFARNNPTKVDLAFPTNAQCSTFGRRNVEIYILE